MNDPEIADLARTVATDLVAEGAKAVVLAGSQVRGDATELSDIDLYAIGSGPAYALRVVHDRLVAVSWRSEDDERRGPAPAGIGRCGGARLARGLRPPRSRWRGRGSEA